MGLKRFFFVAAMFSVSTSWSAQCDFRQPHTLACQQAAFTGHLATVIGGGEFRLVTVDRWADTWSPNQFTPENDASKALFQTVTDANRPNRTCALLGDKGQRISELSMRFRGAMDIRDVEIRNWSGVGAHVSSSWASLDYEVDDKGDVKGPKPLTDWTVVFGIGEKETFRCRVFMRTGVQHLLCEYFKDDKRVGFLGFLPFQAGSVCGI